MYNDKMIIHSQRLSSAHHHIRHAQSKVVSTHSLYSLVSDTLHSKSMVYLERKNVCCLEVT